MSASKKPVTTWDVQELGIGVDDTDRFTMTKMDEPVHESKCEILEGSGPGEKAERLVDKLKEAKVI
jgi:electron transfer flavoprotein alpha/beta subunit